MNYRTTMGWASLFFLALSSGCAGCGERVPPPASLEDPSACVPLEERQDCLITGSPLFLNVASAEDLEMVCKSECKKVYGVSFSDEVVDLSVIQYLEFEKNVSISITRTHHLENLRGLDRFERIDLLLLDNNERLSSLEGLPTLKHIGSLQGEYNKALSSLKGLEEVETIGSQDGGGSGLLLTRNPELSSLEGLNGVREMETLQVTNNPKLRSVDALNSLEQINSELFIGYNDSLTELPEGDTIVLGDGGWTTLLIEQNPKLPQCQIDAFLERLDFGDLEPREKRLTPNGPATSQSCL